MNFNSMWVYYICNFQCFIFRRTRNQNDLENFEKSETNKIVLIENRGNLKQTKNILSYTEKTTEISWKSGSSRLSKSMPQSSKI